MSLQISSTSVEYVKVEVTKDNGSDPTGDTVRFAFMEDGVTPDNNFESVDSPWFLGNWQTLSDSYFARCLVGIPYGQSGGDTIPDSEAVYFELDPGLYVVWLMITDNPEVPVKRVDYLEVL